MPSKRTLIRFSTILLFLSCPLSRSDEYLSNLGDLWPDPTGIGDIHVLFYFYAPFVVHFLTGSALNDPRYAKVRIANPVLPTTNHITIQQFQLDSVTFEFQGGIVQPWSNITMQVCQQVGSNGVPLGNLGNPSLNPTRTQWPGFSSFIDFHPLTNIVLESSSEYFVSLSVPYNYPADFAMLFTWSTDYVTLTDWRMGETTTHDPWAAGEYLMFAVNATAIVATNSTTSQGTNSTGVAVSNVKLSASMVGSKIVLSWPTSTAAAQVYSSPSFDSGGWSPVSTQPATVNNNFMVTLPMSASGSFFRLQAQ